MKQPLSEYIKNKTIRMNLPWRYNGTTNEKGYILAGVCLASEEHIKQMYPIGERITLWNNNHKGDNPDKTKIA